MGMDQHFVVSEKRTRSAKRWRLPEHHYNRKHYRLQGLFSRFDGFKDDTLEISSEILDELEEALVSDDGLPMPSESDSFSVKWNVHPGTLAQTQERRDRDLAMVEWARQQIAHGRVVYYCVSY